MSQLDTAFMRHITHEKMKSSVVQGDVKRKSPVQQKKPNGTKVEFVPMVTEAFGKQLRLFGGVCSDLCGFVLATGGATITAAGTDVRWQMSLEEAV